MKREDIKKEVTQDPDFLEVSNYVDSEVLSMQRQINDLRKRKREKFLEVYGRIEKENEGSNTMSSVILMTGKDIKMDLMLLNEDFVKVLTAMKNHGVYYKAKSFSNRKNSPEMVVLTDIYTKESKKNIMDMLDELHNNTDIGNVYLMFRHIDLGNG